MKIVLISLLTLISSLNIYAQNNAQESLRDPDDKRIPKELIENGDNPILLMFTASWCAPCHYMRNIIFKNEEVSSLLKKYNLIMLDIDTPFGSSLQRYYCDENAVPYYILLDKDQNVLVAQKGANETPGPFAEFLKRGLPQDIAVLRDAVTQTDFDTMTSEDYKAAYSTVNDKVKDKWHFGGEIGANMSNISSSSYNKYKVGYSAMIFARLVSYTSSFTTGLLYNSIGGVSDGAALTLNYIGIPIDAGIKIYKGLQLGAGLAGNYLLTDLSDHTLDYKQYDITLRFNASYQLGHFRISAGYNRGLVNLLKNDLFNSAHNNWFNLSISAML